MPVEAADVRRLDNDEIRMKPEIRTRRQAPVAFEIRVSDLIRHLSFVIRVLVRSNSR